jgi:uncharacterized membrane protein YwaF
MNMTNFFSDQIGQTLEWFGLPHLLLTIGFIGTIVVLWILLPRLQKSKYEPLFRALLLGLGILFEWRVFESRMLEHSLFRMPLCAAALYLLFYAVAFRKRWVFQIAYFYAFGSLLSFLFFDTPYGLDRWSGWTFFGAHAVIAWLAVYGVRVLGFVPSKKDLLRSMAFLALFALISGYATLRFGGSDELFLFHPAVDFLSALQDIHPLLYLTVYGAMAAVLLGAMYLPFAFAKRPKLN